MSTTSIGAAIILAIYFIMLIGGLVLTFISNRYAVAAAYAGMLGIGLILPTVPTTALIFWGIATVIVVALGFMLPKTVVNSRRGVGYIAGAALAGAFVGMVMSHEWMIIGAVVGALLGGIAYSRTPAGKVMEFPSSKFFNYLCAKGLPAIITVCIVGTSVLWLTMMLSM